jgi:hypothetical protein
VIKRRVNKVVQAVLPALLLVQLLVLLLLLTVWCCRRCAGQLTVATADTSSTGTD